MRLVELIQREREALLSQRPGELWSEETRVALPCPSLSVLALGLVAVARQRACRVDSGR